MRKLQSSVAAAGSGKFDGCCCCCLFSLFCCFSLIVAALAQHKKKKPPFLFLRLAEFVCPCSSSQGRTHETQSSQ